MSQSKSMSPIITIYNIQDVGDKTIYINDNIYFSPGFPNVGKIKSLKEVWNFDSFPEDLSKINGENNPYYGLDAFNYNLSVLNNGKLLVNDNIETTNIDEATNYINLSPNVELGFGNVNIVYKVNYAYSLPRYTSIWNFNITYNLYITENTEPLPKWNALTVFNRALNIAEPLRENEAPRFKLDGNQEAWLESIETPEFQFTQSNLREILQIQIF